MADTPALLPCPFCGGKPKASKREGESLWSHQIVWSNAYPSIYDRWVYAALHAQLIEARSQLEASRRDAERYRHLREHNTHYYGQGILHDHDGDELDAAIDREIESAAESRRETERLAAARSAVVVDETTRETNG